MTNKSNIIRGIVAILLWFLIILCFITMIRANSMMAKNLQLINSGAISPEALRTERLVGETARGFVINWATFDTDEAEYKNRLALYGKNDEYSPGDGRQVCNSAEVLEVKESVKNHYRVILEANISRAVKLTDSQAYLVSKDKIISEEKTEKGDRIIYVWQNTQETVEVAAKVIKNQITLLGYPVLVASNNIEEVQTYEILERDDPAVGFTVFGNQMLELYYKGEDLSNYTDSKRKIKPLGGYLVKDSEIIGYENQDGTIKSLFKVTVSQDSPDPSVKEMEQYIFVVAKKASDKWQLLRLGAY